VIKQAVVAGYAGSATMAGVMRVSAEDDSCPQEDASRWEAQRDDMPASLEQAQTIVRSGQ
jgi:hypothetical protein